MAEQFLRAWKVDAEVLLGVVGSGDNTVLRKSLSARDAVQQVDELLEEWGSEPLDSKQALTQILDGKLDPSRAYEYRRVLELLAPALGRQLKQPPEIVLPGRGWQDLKATWKKWGLPNLGRNWGDGLPFPWRKSTQETAVGWPVAMLWSAEVAGAVRGDIDAFDESRVEEGELTLPPRHEDLEDQARHLLENLGKWLAKSKGSSVLLFLDGQQ